MQPDIKYSTDTTVVHTGQLYALERPLLEEGYSKEIGGEGVPNTPAITDSFKVGSKRKLRITSFSPIMLRLSVAFGDGGLLIAMLLLVKQLSLIFHLEQPLSIGLPAAWNMQFLGFCLTLALWSITVTTTRAQELDYVVGILKSPLAVVCTLLIMCIGWLILSALFLGGKTFFSFQQLFLFFLLSTITMGTWRFILAEIMLLPRFRRQAVIVGANPAGERVARELQDAKHPGANVLGYISEGRNELRQQDDLPILGGKSALRKLVQNNVIDMMIMAIDYKTEPELFEEAIEAAHYGVSVVPVTTVYEGTSGKLPIEHIGNEWYIALPPESTPSPLYFCWKKTVDITFGVCGSVVMLLMLPVLGLANLLYSPGPIFYSQERVGYQGKTFRILKFRSMTQAKEGGQSINQAWTTKDDVRITRVGRFLRATHLDELPQVLNILKGDMSLIGPRPERPDFVSALKKDNLFYSYRLSVRPGLTGWAQVKYGYGTSDREELVKLQYDLYYIKHQSFLLDILIILKTIGEVVLGHGV